MLNNVYELEEMYNNRMVRSVLLDTFAYRPKWFEFVDTIDGNLRARYGMRGLLEYYKHADDAEVKADFESILYAYLKSREKEYDVLYELINIQYDPIQNYSMTEIEDGTNTSDNMYGEMIESSEMSFGERQKNDTITHGRITDTETVEIGEMKTTTNGEDKRAPFDSANYENVTKAGGTSTTDARTDTNTYARDGYSDDTNTTENAHEDSNIKTFSEHGDTLHTDFNRRLTRSGNIGVTTSQQMIESSIALAPKFNLIDKISRDIANLVSKGVYYVL